MAQKVLYTLSSLVLSFSAFAQQGMGVGNNNPQEMLDVSGAIKIGTTTNSNTGTIRWNGTNFQGYNGTVWVDLDSQGGADTDWAISGSNQYSAVSGNVGIGTTSPTTKLDVNGQIRMSTGANVGYVPVSDANGVMTWTDPNTVVAPTTTNSLDAAYDQGGAGAGREIDAVDGTVAITGEDGFMVSGTFNQGLAVGAAGGIASGAGTRMFFNPRKAALRAGNVSGTQWDDANIGLGSIAMGSSTTASGPISTAMGSSTTASGFTSTAMGAYTNASGSNSTAMGSSTTASGSNSTAMGSSTNASGSTSTAMGSSTNASGSTSTAMGGNTTASGTYSTAMGFNTIASGSFSTALGQSTNASDFASTAMGYLSQASGTFSTSMGLSTTAPSLAETAMGAYNTAYTPVSTNGWIAADRLLVVGNGTSSTPSNALTIYKNGKMNINDAYDMPTVGGSAGQVLTTNGSVASWQDPGGGSSIADDDNDTKIQVEEIADEDKIRFDTDGSERMIIDNSGSVGIGTTAPESLLNVVLGNNGLNTPLVLRNTNTTAGGNAVGVGFANGDVNNAPQKAMIVNERTESFGRGKLHFILNDAAAASAATLADSKMTIDRSGNVGIGTTGPIAKLDVVGGSVALNDSQLRLRAGNDGNHFLAHLGGSFDGPLLQGLSTVVLKTGTHGDASGVFLRNNRVGIGIANPTNGLLHVEGYHDVNFGYQFFNSGGSTGWCGSCNSPISIWAQHRIATSELNVFSDARIKDVIGVSDREQDLSTLMDIQVIDYTYKDKIGRGNAVFKKVVAQQLEEVYPVAVSKTVNTVPDIYQLATITHGVISLTEIDLKPGDRLKLITENGSEQMVTVEAIGENGIHTSTDLTGQVFVYGREVDDFRTVDYEAIAMLNVSATQELFKLITKLQADNQQLKDKLHDYSSLKSDVELLKEAMGIDMQSAK
jgi:hypothetical protein